MVVDYKSIIYIVAGCLSAFLIRKYWGYRIYRFINRESRYIGKKVLRKVFYLYGKYF